MVMQYGDIPNVGRKGPAPSVGFPEQVDIGVDPPLQYAFSGELTTTKNFNLGTVRNSVRLDAPILSVLECGRDDGNTLSVELDVKINGTSALSTKPKIVGNAGKASAQATTASSGTNITQGVIDGDNNLASPGDVITGRLTIVRTATPTTEIANPSVLVPLRSMPVYSDPS